MPGAIGVSLGSAGRFTRERQTEPLSPPLDNSYWVHPGVLAAGAYPGSLAPDLFAAKCKAVVDSGIRRMVSLLEPQEFGQPDRPIVPYAPVVDQYADGLGITMEFHSFPIRDGSAPSQSQMGAIIDLLRDTQRSGTPTYLHCLGGHGRTSTVVACFLISQGLSARDAMDQVVLWRHTLRRHRVPFVKAQEEFISVWSSRYQTT